MPEHGGIPASLGALRATRALNGPELPAELADLPDPPDTLHVAGAWPAAPMVAIVGARAATAYGLRLARGLAADLARLGFAIVSGLARGIDAAAHEGALEAGGITVAVLPGSLDVITPDAHADLARRIARHGALAAEWASGMPARPGLFLRRNRLIAALARATIVVEAAERSGALATAAVARRLARPVLAVPGDVDRPTSRGCNALLRHGARVCEGPADVLEALGGAAVTTRAHDTAPAAASRSAETDAARVAAALAVSPCALEMLARRAGLAPERALAALTQLEWAGLAVVHPGARWSAPVAASR